MASALDELLAFADNVGARVTSKGGGRHNPGSKHYSGEAIDIDHSKITDVNALYKLAQQQGFRVLDERTRPTGQAVWGGPHFHVEVDRAARKGQSSKSQTERRIEQSAKSLEADKAAARKQIDSFLANQPLKRETNFFQDIGRGVVSPFDPQSPLPQNPIAGTIGTAIPALGATIAGGLVGGPVGAGAAGAGVFGTMEANRQRREGEQTNVGKIGLQAAGGFAGGALPVLRGGSALSAIAKNFGINAALEGGVEAGTQLMDGKISDPGRVFSQAAIGGAMGLAPVALEGLTNAKAPRVPGTKKPVVELPVDIKTRIAELEGKRFQQPEAPVNTQELTDSFNARANGQPEILNPNKLTEQSALNDLSTRPIIEPVNDAGLVVARKGETKPRVEILDAQGRPIKSEAPIPRGTDVQVDGQPAKVIANPEGKVKVRLNDGTTKVVDSTPSGAFTDVLDEYLATSGVNYNVVRQLKSDLDAVDNIRAEVKAKQDELSALGKNVRTDEAKALREEIRQLKETIRNEGNPLKARWGAVDDNIKEIAGLEVDPNTGIGIQKPINPEKQLPLSAIVDDLDETAARNALAYAEAMASNNRVKERYIAEQTGRSNEVAKLTKGGRVMVQATEFSPTHFGYLNATFPDGVRRMPVVHGYNQRGHEAVRYLMQSPKGSKVQSAKVMSKAAFKGPTPNIMQGQGTFDARELLARGPRTERGFIKTSEAVKTLHEQKQAIRSAISDAGLSDQGKELFAKVIDGNDLSYDEALRLKTELTPDKLGEFCRTMGLQ